MNGGSKHIMICSTSIAAYDRRIQRISKTLSSQYMVSWISRGSLKVEWLTHFSLNSIFGGGFLFYAFFNFRLFLQLLFRKYDIICAVDLDTVLPCYLVSKLRGKTLVFDAHEHFTEVPELDGRKFVKSVWRWVEKISVTKIKNNYTVGPALAKIFAERHGTKYEVIRNVPPRKKENRKRNHDGKTIVYLGMVNEGRGVELAIQSLVELKNKQLKIIGSGDVEVDMKVLVKKLALEDRVEFLGFVQPDEIDQHLEHAWIAVNMLNPISKSYYYSLANKFFDYLQAGLPMVNMAFPEYEAIHKNYKTGSFAKTYTVEALMQGVKNLENEVYYEQCVSELNDAKSAYCWEVEGKKLLDFYCTLD